MKVQKLLGLGLSLIFLALLSSAVVTSAPAVDPDPASLPATTYSHQAQAPDIEAIGLDKHPEIPTASAAQAWTGPIIIDHTSTDLNKIPTSWIEQAKAQLRLSYGHTSHGSQPISGMGVLRDNPAYGDLYNFNIDGGIQAGVLSLRDRYPSGDLGNPDRTTWASRTRDYLNGAGTDRNVVIWSWCGQASSATENDINTYLSLMNQLEQEFPSVTFVYMTGHLDGTGESGNLHQRNNQIREYCRANNKILFDFADIESYDPNGNYYLDMAANDGCYYDSDGNGSRDSNWADEWCAAHPGECSSCSCAHSHSLNCDLKARAFWWMLARIAGWGGIIEEEDGGPRKTAAPGVPEFGETITYTIVVQDLAAPLDAAVYLTDVVPSELSYIPDTLTATSGTVTDTDGPTLTWSGVLTPTPVVTVTYAVTVNIGETQAITNSVVFAAPGYPSVTRTAMVIANGYKTHLPIVFKGISH